MSKTGTSIADLLHRCSILQTVSDTPRLDLEVLLCQVLKKSRSYLYAWPEKELSIELLRDFELLFQRRLNGEPIAYLTGTKEFWSLPLAVNTATIIPRPETELLVEVALSLSSAAAVDVLDLGTGTGAIALALASERAGWQILAVDVMPEAVRLAKKNRADLGLENVTILHSDWFTELRGQVFDLIISNPPYIEINDPHLTQGDLRYEPASALVADHNGLAALQVIAGQATQYLKKDGWLLLEHGCQQGASVRSLLADCGFNKVSTTVDASGLERVTMGKYTNEGGTGE